MKTDRWNRTPGQSPEQVRKAVILAAGVGDRLRPFTNKFPKSLVEVGGVSILDNTLTHLAACGTEEVAKSVRAELHIWNINGFAESFLRQAPRHRKAFRQSCALVRDHCHQLYRGLTELPGVTAYRPQANFVMCRVPASGPSAPDVARGLFVEHSILVKHCDGKHMEDGDRYLRLASKTESENRVLVEAMRQCLSR